MSAASIVVEAVAVDRDGQRLLNEVSLEVAPGDLVGIVGPNGAGKSTVLRVIAGDIAPSSGSSRLVGVDPAGTGLQHLARLRSYVGPQTVSDASFRAAEVVAMGRYPFRASDPDQSAEEEIVTAAMKRVDVQHLAPREMRSLSSGEQQRVRISTAMAQGSPVMLLDEPTSALDVGHQELVMRVLGELAAVGNSVVAVLHDLNLAAFHADRLVLLDSGNLVAQGSPERVLTGDRLSAAYRQPMTVIDHPFRRCPLVLPSS